MARVGESDSEEVTAAEISCVVAVRRVDDRLANDDMGTRTTFACSLNQMGTTTATSGAL